MTQTTCLRKSSKWAIYEESLDRRSALTCLYGLSLYGSWWHAVFCITNNRHDVTITTHAIKRHFLIWLILMTAVRQPTKCRCSCVLTLKYNFICVYWWTRQRIDNTLIVVDRYLRLMGDYKNPLYLDVVDRYLRRMGDKTIPDEAPPSLGGASSGIV